MVTGWAFIWGMKVGILGNNGVIYSRGGQQGDDSSCSSATATAIPLLFLHNVTGFMVGREYERRGITKDGAKMLMVQANVTVPKLSVLVPRLPGRRQLRDGGPRLGPAASCSPGPTRAPRSWAPSRRRRRSPRCGSPTLKREQGREPSPEEIARIRREVGDYFEETYHPYHLTSDLRDDGLIDPIDTRNALGMSLSAALNAPIVRTPGGVLRI